MNIVPIPGFWPSGIHKIKTAKLIKNVIIPILKLTLREIPCASTLQGEAPVKETINKPSPKPNKTKPKHRKKNVENSKFYIHYIKRDRSIPNIANRYTVYIENSIYFFTFENFRIFPESFLCTRLSL